MVSSSGRGGFNTAGEKETRNQAFSDMREARAKARRNRVTSEIQVEDVDYHEKCRGGKQRPVMRLEEE